MSAGISSTVSLPGRRDQIGFQFTNPSTGAGICTVPDSAQHDGDAALVCRARGATGLDKAAGQRARRGFRAIAAKIRERAEPLARVITEEQGKTLGWLVSRCSSRPITWTTWRTGSDASRARPLSDQ
jgi:acyl-CoA reductase-like NAD-dependent aldehyde dehydrogenase